MINSEPVIAPKNVDDKTETLPAIDADKPVMVSVNKAQLDSLIAAKSLAETKVAQLEQDIKDAAMIGTYLFETIQKAEGLMSLVPVGKISKALIQGKMPSFTADEIQKLLLKAKDKIVKDDNFSLAVVHLINIYNRYAKVAGGVIVPEIFKTELENVLN
ncbi:hypothetical protein [Emticicia sp. W12TSBA100-4]|uniref:hypothetical protein n=1 Tax=Emticicia sp. W12TSBA100-4 TaxID=3160965 RepID=UPI003305B20B